MSQPDLSADSSSPVTASQGVPTQAGWPEDQATTQSTFTPRAPGAPPAPRPRPARAAAPLLLAACLALLADALTHGTKASLGINLPVWIGVYLIATLTVLQRGGRTPSRQGLTLLAGALALSTLFTVRDAPETLRLLNACALFLALMLGSATLRFPDFHLKGVAHMIGTALSGALSLLIGPFVLLERFPWTRLKPEVRGGHGRWLTGAILTLPVLLLFGSLLASADAAFAGLFQHLRWPEMNLLERGFTLLLWGAVTGGLVYPALLAGRRTLLPGRTEQPLKLGLTEIAMPLLALSALYGVFLLVQLPHLLSGTLPDGLTYAGYIRQGFGELMTAAFLTLALLLTAHGITHLETRASTAYRAVNLAVLAPLALIMLSAANRWFLYHQAYGLSETRLLGLAFLVWLTACLAWLTRLIWLGDLRRFAYPALLAGFFTLWATTMLNPAAMIARDNLHRQNAAITNHLRSTPQQASAWELLNLGADAVPAIVQNLDTLGRVGMTRQDIINKLHDRYDPPRDPRAWNASYTRAYRLVQQLPPATPHGREYNGD